MSLYELGARFLYNAGRRIMGDTTYNHVYGNGTTGDITNAMRVHQAAGEQPMAYSSKMNLAHSMNLGSICPEC